MNDSNFLFLSSYITHDGLTSYYKAIFFLLQTLKKEGNLFKIQHYGTTVGTK